MVFAPPEITLAQRRGSTLACPHGNLSLDSLLLVPTPLAERAIDDDLQFFVYVTDLALWEHLFLPTHAQPPTPTPAQDLVDLGYVAYQLLTGNDDRPNLLLEQPWATVNDLPLKQFLRQLGGGDFKANVEEARQTLLHLPWQEPIAESAPPAHALTPFTNSSNVLRRLLVLGLLGGIGVGLGVGWRSWAERSGAGPTLAHPCCLTEIALPDTAVSYTTEAGGIWSDILRTPNRVAFNRSLEQTLQERDRRLNRYTLTVVAGEALAAVQSGEAAFALTEWRDSLPAGLHQEVVALDGLVIVVAFGDGNRAHTVPQALQGTISFEQLRQLYTGTPPDWRLATPLQDWTIQLYRPNDPAAIAHFERLVLQTDGAIERFRALPIATLPATQMFGNILQDFEQRQTIGIGFARLSQVINQCSVYPLAVQQSGRPVQAIGQTQGHPITPTTDLCGDKGSYQANVAVFNTDGELRATPYPLKSRLTVVYRQDSQAGRQFAAALKTDEGQALLRAAGLVPLRPLDDR
ncbi:MAG: hypothetical protein HC881_03250 [Leptolyngbyaceae cyanobacterium SL_7_1]|nr:hypothetical protein [Leptolyngbyaceae cyanobacterium SL_7_1]